MYTQLTVASPLFNTCITAPLNLHDHVVVGQRQSPHSTVAVHNRFDRILLIDSVGPVGSFSNGASSKANSKT